MAAVMIAITACGGEEAAPAPSTRTTLDDSEWSRAQRLEALLSTLAADSMEGRRTGSAGAHRAAGFLAAELERYGVEPAGDEGGYLQTVPMARMTEETDNGVRERMVMEIDYEDWDALPPESVIVSESNVIGIIRGADPEVANEAIVVGAHFDHVGIGRPVSDAAGVPDSIYNGADDDGSGTVTVMELARQFQGLYQKGMKPRRSVLFMNVVGEEKGLLGSQHYVENPVFSLENTVANLNVDMIGRVDEAHAKDENYVYLIGSDKLSSTLHELSEEANRTSVQLALDYTFNDPDDPNRYYYRSDHYNFAKNNIPVIFYFTGVHEDYHQPGDDVEKIRFTKMSKIGKLIFHTAWDIANRDERPAVDKVNDFPSDR